MKIIDGKKIAQKVREELKKEISALEGRTPALAFILVGDDPGSKAYVRMKKKGCQEVGIHSEVITLPEEVSEETLLKEITRLNQTPEIDGILVQQPLPKHISLKKMIEGTNPAKDVDGFHPLNLGRLTLGETEGFIPCTPLGIVKLLEKSDIKVVGKEVVIIGRSIIVGKPLSLLLLQKDATVTITHSKTKNLKEVCKRADILIVAIGKPHFVGVDMVKPEATVIDVGINRTKEGLVGDVDFESVKEIASAITPVPGGVGPMTIAMLLSNTLKSYKWRCDIF